MSRKARSQARPSNRVYSTETGRTCPGCLRPKADCVCKDRSKPLVATTSAVCIHRETKGRKGSGVSLIKGLALSADDLKVLARELKAACGVGGSVKAGVIELQGDQREKIRSLLAERGIQAKIAGG